MWAFGSSFGFLDAGYDKDNTLFNIAKALHEGGYMGQAPWLDKWTRANPWWQHLPFFPKNSGNYVADTALNGVARYQGLTKEAMKNEKSLLASFMHMHEQSPEKLPMDFIVANSIAAV